MGLDEMSIEGQLERTYTARGLERFQMEIWHEELNKYQLIKGNTESEVLEKVDAKCAQWDEMWDKRSIIEERKLNIQRNKEIAKKRTKKVKNKIAKLNNILKYRKNVVLRDLFFKKSFSIPPPEEPILSLYPERPIYPIEPMKNDIKYDIKLTFFEKYIHSLKMKRIKEKKKLFRDDHLEWKLKKERMIYDYTNEMDCIKKLNNQLIDNYNKDMKKWKRRSSNYNLRKNRYNRYIKNVYQGYINKNEESIEKYIYLILKECKYPEVFPENIKLSFNKNNSILIIETDLPNIDKIPKTIQVKYIQNIDEFNEIKMSFNELNIFYNNIIYQIPFRIMYEVYSSDIIKIINSIVVNGYVSSIDHATGKKIHPCIISIQTSRNDFTKVNLNRIIPKECFKKFKGVGSSKLHTITPIPPIINISKSDKRFVNGYNVESFLEDGDNIAAMDWHDFENLIRELFQKEFSKYDGEVKVTRSSRDGGVDAVAFDNDPIRGGKIVIQAKRYTNTVEVSAVRDLYGTVINEGATKGILITTADYGPDAYTFAKDKPISLLNGGHLLHMLRDHGHTVKIDLKEAKEILSEND